MVLPKHTYRDWLKNVAKTVENHYHQNEVKNLEIVNNQYLVYSIKSGTSLTCGGINDSDVLLLLICPFICPPLSYMKIDSNQFININTICDDLGYENI